MAAKESVQSLELAIVSRLLAPLGTFSDLYVG